MQLIGLSGMSQNEQHTSWTPKMLSKRLNTKHNICHSGCFDRTFNSESIARVRFTYVFTVWARLAVAMPNILLLAILCNGLNIPYMQKIFRKFRHRYLQNYNCGCTSSLSLIVIFWKHFSDFTNWNCEITIFIILWNFHASKVSPCTHCMVTENKME